MNEISRDEHLRAALRHAPDAALAAPEPVSAHILAAAHRAAAEAAPRAPARRRWWALPVWRLGASGALASVLLAGVVGLLWREAPPGPVRMDDAAQAPALKAPAVPPAVGAMAPPAAKVQQEAATPEPAAAAVPQAAAMPTPVLQAPALNAAGPTAAADTPRAVAAEGSASTAQPPAASRRPAPLRTSVLAEAPAAPPAAPVPPWADALRQKSGARDVEASDTAAAWLGELARQTLGPWRDAADNVPPPEPPDFVLSRGSATAGRLWLRDGQALWCDAADRCQQAPLRPDAEAALRQGLPRPR